MPADPASAVFTDPARRDEPTRDVQREADSISDPRDHAPALAPVWAHDQALAERLDPDIAADFGEPPLLSGIYDEAELGRQRRELRRIQAIGKGARDLPLNVIVLKAAERIDDNVPPRFELRIEVEQVEFSEAIEQRAMTSLGHAAKLQVGAVRQVDLTVAISVRQRGQTTRLIRA